MEEKQTGNTYTVWVPSNYTATAVENVLRREGVPARVRP